MSVQEATMFLPIDPALSELLFSMVLITAVLMAALIAVALLPWTEREQVALENEAREWAIRIARVATNEPSCPEAATRSGSPARRAAEAACRLTGPSTPEVGLASVPRSMPSPSRSAATS